MEDAESENILVSARARAYRATGWGSKPTMIRAAWRRSECAASRRAASPASLCPRSIADSACAISSMLALHQKRTHTAPVGHSNLRSDDT